MKIAVVCNLSNKGVINFFGRQNREQYSLAEIEAVVEALRGRKHAVETFEGDKFLIEKLEAFMPRVLKGEHPGLVFNLAYGIQGESRYTHIPSLLEMLGVPYVGSGPLAHSIALDKAMTKIVLSRAGLPTPAFQVATSYPAGSELSLRFPLMVKPKDEAVSFGVRVVENADELREAVEATVQEFRQPALVEEFLSGRELNIGLLGNGQDIELLPIVEIDFGEATERYQTFDSKKAHRFAHRCPADIPASLAETIRALARRAFEAVGCRDRARIDLRLDEQGEPQILEINSMPAIHRQGSFFAAARVAGYDYAAMVNRMVEVAEARYFGAATATAPRAPGDAGGVTELLRRSSEKMERRLAELVDCNSSPRNKEGNDRIGLLVEKALEPLGFRCQVFPQTEIGNTLLLQNRFEGERADVLLLGHTDVLGSDPEDGHRRFSKDGNRLFGAGVAESKGGLVVIEYALKALRSLRQLSQLRIRVLLTTDHALENRYSGPIVKAEAERAHTVLCFKPGGAEGEVVTRRNGVGTYSALVECATPIVRTEYLHTGGANAIGELAHKVHRWNRLSDPDRQVLVCVTSLRGEARRSKSPETAHASIFLSFPDEHRGEELDAEIRAIARRHTVPTARCTLQGGIQHAPFQETAEVLELYGEVAGLAAELGMPLGKSMRYTSSEIALVGPGKRALDGLGPVGHNTRTEEEHVEANTLVERAVLLARLLPTLAGAGR